MIFTTEERKSLESIVAELSQIAEEAARFEVEDMVKWVDTQTGEEVDRVGVIEDIDEEAKTATVRVMAQAGEAFEPTDTVRSVRWEELAAYGTDNEEGDGEQEVDTEEETEVESKGICPGDFVQFATIDGPATGRVVKAAKTVDIEVYAPIGVCHEPTGVVVTRKASEVQAAATPKVPLDGKHLMIARLKNVTASDQTNDAGEQVGVIEGDGSTYGSVDMGGDTVAKGSFTQTLSHSGGIIPAFFDHGWTTDTTAGVAYLTDSDTALKCRIEMPLGIPRVKECYEMIKFQMARGVKMGLSIGYDPLQSKAGPNGTRILTEVKLYEMTITPFPMNTEALITSAKSRKASYAEKAARWAISAKKATPKPDAPKGSPTGGEGGTELLPSAIQHLTQHFTDYAKTGRTIPGTGSVNGTGGRAEDDGTRNAN